ncbi:MAG: hypothetical protein KDA88_23205 [Planctomycetaceae bacterium]|nr:hypothetical protein [Planctomycetaceae bacterium]MCB9951033.1 hypothetical protein [Planctomycetaceae bacterium]
MDIRQNPIFMGFSMGRWWNTNVRVSAYFPALAIVLCVQLGLKLGLAATFVLFMSILFHEFCHIIAARRTGGSGEEILIWPLGGLAFVQPGASFTSRFWTPAAGPISNLILFLATLPAVLYHGAPAGTFHLIYVPNLELVPSTLLLDFLILICTLNLKLTVLNLLPIYPLDGSQMATEVAARYHPREIARQGALWFSLFLCIVMTLIGAMLNRPELGRNMMPLIYLGFTLMVFGMYEFLMHAQRRALGDWMGSQDDTFLGYDFSKGYAAFDEEDESPSAAEVKRQQEIEAKRQREEQEREEIRQRVDELLEKVHQGGLDSLSDAERQFLRLASKKYPSRG